MRNIMDHFKLHSKYKPTGDHICHCKSLTGTSHSKQRLKLVALLKSFYQLLDRMRLIPGWFVFCVIL